MTQRPPAACTHELRPGTKVCLHCRRTEREATATRHRAILVKTGLIAAAIGAIVFAGVSGLDAWQQRSGAGLGSLIATPSSLEAAPLSQASAAPRALMASAPASPAALMPIAAASPSPAAVLSMRPVIAEGRTDLQNGIYALRAGDTVTVHFDTPEARTRRAEKFEQIVRATLPEVHGSGAESLLATIATGNLVSDADLVGEQPLGPIRLRGRDGQSLSLWPQMRAGRDGPLVVAYRITPAP